MSATIATNERHHGTGCDNKLDPLLCERQRVIVADFNRKLSRTVLGILQRPPDQDLFLYLFLVAIEIVIRYGGA